MPLSEQHRIMQEVEASRLAGLKDKLTAENRAYLQSGASESQLIEKVKSVASRDLKDPDSAKFRAVSINRSGGAFVVCGELNAKNSYGGYVGYERFAASAESVTKDPYAIPIVCN